MRGRRNTNGSVPRLASGAGQSVEADVPCCCGCGTCCYKVTFSGVTFDTSALLYEVDHQITTPDDYTVQITSVEGSINGTFYICNGTNYIPVAMLITYTHNEGDDDYTSCGYVYVSVSHNTISDTLTVIVGVPMLTVPNEEDQIFNGVCSLTTEQSDQLDAQASCEDWGTAEADNSLTQGFSYPFTLGTGSVVVELVPNCDGTYDNHLADCTTEGTLTRQTICDPDCPCGYTDEQPVCTQVEFNDPDGDPNVYQDGRLISGTETRDYAFYGPFQRGDGTWYRFLIITDLPEVAEPNADGAYLELACAGPGADNYSGTYTIADPADWLGVSTIGPMLDPMSGNHQTALANLTTATVSDCECAAADDVYTVGIDCEVGVPPAGWTDITVTRAGESCYWEGVGGGRYAKMWFVDGTWYASVERSIDNVLIVDATWIAAGDDPTGTHPFNNTDTGWTGDTALDDTCGDLAIVIS